MMKESISIDEICHKHNIGFIKADVCGVFASVFCDFGTGFQVLDVDGEHSSCLPFALMAWVSSCLLYKASASCIIWTDLLHRSRTQDMTYIAGEEPATGIIASIIPGNPTLITCVDDERMDFQASSCHIDGAQSL
jgi:ubiquitin-activating enzyme E1